MDIQNRMIHRMPLDDPEDLDVLLEFAELLRDAVSKKRDGDVCNMIRYTIDNGYLEAFYWAMGIFDEAYGQTQTPLSDFQCVLGTHIPDYNGFISRLGVNLNAFENDILPVRDENGEVQSFFNIIKYKTGFSHIELLTLESFDAKDNDYIQYMLLCRCQ